MKTETQNKIKVKNPTKNELEEMQIQEDLKEKMQSHLGITKSRKTTYKFQQFNLKSSLAIK